MDWFAISGYLAAGLTFTTFCMKTMMPLRIVGISSNVAFICYSILGDLYPVVILHGVLLPLNVFRLYQVQRLVQQVAATRTGELSLDCLIPVMSKRPFAKGDVVFRKGDDAHELYVVVDGTVRLQELDVTIGPGQIFGEIGLFAPSRRRTQTVVCDTDVDAFSITDKKIYELYFQNPKLGFDLMRLIIGRLQANATR